jgi:hypothetical protein
LTSDAAFPTAFNLRIQEALQYITGKAAIWRVRLESEGTKLVLELASPWRRSGRTQFSPPISPASVHLHKHGWDLFACYLTYVVEKTEGTHWNPVAYHLYNACEATANSIDAWAVGVSVATEAVAGLIELPSDDAKAERLALFQKRMRECLGTQTDFPDLAPRMEGSIAAMSNKRPQDTCTFSPPPATSRSLTLMRFLPTKSACSSDTQGLEKARSGRLSKITRPYPSCGGPAPATHVPFDRLQRSVYRLRCRKIPIKAVPVDGLLREQVVTSLRLPRTKRAISAD